MDKDIIEHEIEELEAYHALALAEFREKVSKLPPDQQQEMAALCKELSACLTEQKEPPTR